MLKKQNWVIDLFMMLFTFGTYIVIPAYSLKLFEKNKWYSNYKYWLFGTLMFLLPVIIMLIVLVIQMTVAVASKAKIDGSTIYENPYIWIGLLIVPIIGWCLFIVMYLYLQFSIVFQIKNGVFSEIEKRA